MDGGGDSRYCKEGETETCSCRPISLLSCISILAERLVQHRLRRWLESAEKLNRNQAGFRKGHSTLDQLARVTQTIFDCFESKKPQRAVLVVLDYARAYDGVARRAVREDGTNGCARMCHTLDSGPAQRPTQE